MGFTANSAPAVVGPSAVDGVPDCGVPLGDCSEVRMLVCTDGELGRDYQLGLGRAHWVAVHLHVGNRIVVIGARRPLKLHVPDVVACFDDDPSMQVYLQTAASLVHSPTQP